jgi:omega-6 fatty acid desaturase (delta-12 desaturase)
MKVLVIASEPISAGCIRERGDSRLDPSFRRDSLARYAEPDVRRSMLDVATSAVPYVALSALIYLARDVSSLLVLVIAVPAAGFLIRTFVVFHDCAQARSSLPGGPTPARHGVRTPRLLAFHSWRREHAVHHATSGDLDRRGMGDVDTLTFVSISRGRGRIGSATASSAIRS